MDEIIKKERALIDRIDREVIKLLGSRMGSVRKIGREKKKAKLPPRDDKRWRSMAAKRKQLALRAKLDPKMVGQIYEIIHRYALKIEKKP